MFPGPNNRVPDEVAKQRYAICQGCSHFWDITRQCGICKCYLPLKVKTKYDLYNDVTHCALDQIGEQPKW